MYIDYDYYNDRKKGIFDFGKLLVDVNIEMRKESPCDLPILALEVFTFPIWMSKERRAKDADWDALAW